MIGALTALENARFDHVGVVVKSLNRGRGVLTQALGIQAWTAPLEDPVNGVYLQFGRDPTGMVYELLTPLDATSPVQGALVARKNLLNHTAYRVPNLALAGERLRQAGCAPTADPKPAIAFGNRLIQFYVTPINIIVELIEAPNHQHMFEIVA